MVISNDSHVKAMAKEIEQLRYKHDIHTIFQDWVEIMALSLSNACDKEQFAEREERYMQIIGKYTKEEALKLAGLFNMLVTAMEYKPDDYLGRLFMDLNLFDTWKGQFFTPYHVAALMAATTIGPDLKEKVREKGYIHVADPTVGAGVTLIAAYNQILDLGYNPQQVLRVFGQDIDEKAVHMSYVQLALLGVQGEIIHGNSLTVETRATWRMPGNYLFGTMRGA